MTGQKWGSLAEAIALAPSEGALITAGRNGDVQAQIIHHYRPAVPMPPEHWNGELDYERSRIRPCVYVEDDSNGRQHMSIPGWVFVRVDLDSVREHFGLDQGEAAPRNKGGRPCEWDWEEFWLELAAMVHEEGFPKTNTELANKMAQRFINKHDDHPALSEMRKRIARLRERLGLAEN